MSRWPLPLLPIVLFACTPSPDPSSLANPTAPATQAPAPTTTQVGSTAPPLSASTPPSSTTVVPTASTVTPVASTTPAPEEKPLPNVKVANIGIHIGGGPNDNITKEPFKKSVQPYYDEMKRCWAMVEGEKGDVSVELRVEHQGGKARVKPNKSTFRNREFNDCIYKIFERIDFLKPRTGTTVLNFSIRFTPGP